VAAGLAAGVLAGAATGAAMLSGAGPQTGGPLPIILHAAPALVRPAALVDLAAATYCQTPDLPSCVVTRAVALVRQVGAPGWTEVVGRRVEGVWRFRVPGELVPDDGFAYWLRLTTGEGQQLSYPPGGAASAIRVVTSVGLPVEALGRIDWRARQTPVGTMLRLRPGDGERRVGFVGRDSEEGLQGPSSFDVTPDGGVVVADWVHSRIQRYSARGRYVGAIALPVRRPVDLAAGVAGRLVLTTLGVDAEAFEVGADGTVLGRYPVGYGIASRVAAGQVPRVRVGAAQWVPVRSSVGVPIEPAAQAWAQTSSVPLPDGAVGVSQDLEGAVAAVWTRSDGSRGGAVVRLPHGVAPGADYFVQPLPDGGAVMARGLWDATHFGVGIFRFGASGRLTSFHLLPEPTPRMVAPYATVRFLAPGTVLLAVDDGGGVRIDRFPVG
jgi:hypothetical protein